MHPDAALFQAIHTQSNQLLGILVPIYFKLYIHIGTYLQVSWCSSALVYTYPQEHPLGITLRCLSSLTHTQEPKLGYPCAALFQAMHTHRNLLFGILVQLYFQLYIDTGTYSRESWCSSLSSYTYTQETTLRNPGAALFQA